MSNISQANKMNKSNGFLSTVSNSLLFTLLAVAFFAAVLATNMYLKGFNVDLTEQQVYSLSAGSENIMKELAEPIELTLFFSEESSTGMTPLRDYAARVKSLLAEYARKSNGKISLSVIDPKPFSEEEDRAAGFGLTAAATGFSQDSIYFGLAGTNAQDDSMIIGFFDPQKESFLEYDISNLIYQLSQAEPVKLTLLTDLQLAGEQNPLTRQITPASVLYQQLNDFFELSLISSSDNQIPEDTQVLMILHPQNINPDLLLSIDQYLMQNGKALLFIDPHYESDPMSQMGAVGVNSSVLPLLEHYGIQALATDVVLDAQTGLEVRSGDNQVIRHLGILGLGEQQIDRDDITSADLDTINGASFGHLSLLDTSLLQQTVLIASSVNSGTISSEAYAKISDPNGLNAQFSNQNKQYTLAARYSGKATSYFANRELPAQISANEANTDLSNTEELSDIDSVESNINDVDNNELSVNDTNAKPRELEIAETDNMSLVVIADADMTADRFWVQQSQFFGQTVFSPFANNGDFIINLLENLGGSEGLIGIRSRGTFARPFTRVQKIQVEAEQKFRKQEQRLQQQLQETEAQLSELQNQSDSLTLSAEQQAAIDDFTQQRISIRKSLRDVQFQLNKDIDELGNWLKLINIAVAPIMLILLLLMIAKLMRKKAPAI